MTLHHIGIVSDTKEKAERFYGDFLSLKRVREYMVSPDLAEQIFSIRQEIEAIVYEADNLRIEVFIYPESRSISGEIRHFALHIDDIGRFLKRAEEFAVEQIVGRSGDKTVYFIKDFSGNLIEIKQQS